MQGGLGHLGPEWRHGGTPWERAFLSGLGGKGASRGGGGGVPPKPGLRPFWGGVPPPPIGSFFAYFDPPPPKYRFGGKKIDFFQSFYQFEGGRSKKSLRKSFFSIFSTFLSIFFEKLFTKIHGAQIHGVHSKTRVTTCIVIAIALKKTKFFSKKNFRKKFYKNPW